MRLHSHSWGPADARPIVGLHGVTGHGERFRRLAEERLPDHRVIGVDLRGHGRSGYEPPWNTETHVDDLAETARALGIERAAWAGFSFGGRLVAELALNHPELVERLLLLDPALELPPEFALESAEQERANQTFASPEEAIEARYAVGTLVATPRDLLEEDVRQHLVAAPDGRLAYRYSKAAAVTAWGEMARPAPAVAAVPTLLVLGTESHVSNAGQADRYRAALGGDLEVLELRAGHSLLWDAFEPTADAVARFVA